MSELKERFLTVYKETVTRAGSDSLLDWLEHSDFFVAPASTKYHGCYEGGLLQHSLNVYDCLKIGIEAAGLQGVYSEETIAIVSLMHDLCKVNYYKRVLEMSRMKRLDSGIRKRSMRLMRSSLAENTQISLSSSFRTSFVLNQKKSWRFVLIWVVGTPQ